MMQQLNVWPARATFYWNIVQSHVGLPNVFCRYFLDNESTPITTLGEKLKRVSWAHRGIEAALDIII